MGGKVAFYVEKLKSQKDWDGYLMKESGLPGPRGNLELAQAFAEFGDEEKIKNYLSIKLEDAPTNSARVFLTFCGVVGLGTLINKGKRKYLPQLRGFASDPRWRIREAVAMALQRVGDVDIDFLLQEMKKWSKGNLLEKRAAAAALCEPRLLTSEKIAGAVLGLVDRLDAEPMAPPDLPVRRLHLPVCQWHPLGPGPSPTADLQNGPGRRGLLGAATRRQSPVRR